MVIVFDLTAPVIKSLVAVIVEERLPATARMAVKGFIALNPRMYKNIF